MQINDAKDTVHHIINKYSRDLFDCLNDTNNTTPMKQWPHRKHHIANWNEHPLQTMQKQEYFMQVMSEKAKELYQALIAMNEKEFYDSRFIKKI